MTCITQRCGGELHLDSDCLCAFNGLTALTKEVCLMPLALNGRKQKTMMKDDALRLYIILRLQTSRTISAQTVNMNG